MSTRAANGPAPAPGATWVDCLFGSPCPVPVTVTPGDPRLGIFRRSPYVSLFFRNDRFARLLYRDWRHTAAWAQILMRSAALNAGRAEPISLRRIAADSNLSISNVVGILAQAEEMGAVTKHRFEEDRRQLTLAPSRSLLDFTEEICAHWCISAAAFVQRADPWHGLRPADLMSLQRILCVVAALSYRQLGKVEHGFDRKTFAFSMLDLLIDPGQSKAAFVPIQAERLRVTQQTIRNVVARAARSGWLDSGDGLRLSAMGEERICAALSLIEFRWRSILDALETPGRLQELDAATTAQFQTPRPSLATSPGPD